MLRELIVIYVRVEGLNGGYGEYSLLGFDAM
jgi:hypothetical protein